MPMIWKIMWYTGRMFEALIRPRRRAEPATEEDDRIEVAGVPVRLTVSTRARRISLRIDAVRAEAVLVRPKGVSRARALAFLDHHGAWLARQAARIDPGVPYIDGGVIPYRGADLTLRAAPGARRGCWLEGDVLHVSGQPEHFARRVRDWLKDQALAHAKAAVPEYTDRLGCPTPRVAVRDPRTRWGSCSSRGVINFSWRLILAPPHVFDYVVAHEVAHLREANHGPRFWALVTDLYGPEWESARAWLHAHGPALMRVGAVSGE